MTPTWYDLLGVEPDASADEIRATWKAAIADLDPGDRRFRALNEAAEVLLDTDKRAAYDATLVSDDEEAQEEEPQAETPPTRQKLTGGAKRGRSVSDVSGETEAELEARSETHAEQNSRTKDQRKAVAEGTSDQEQEPSTPAGRPVPAWLLAALALLTALAIAAAGYLFTQPSDDSIAGATTEAQGSAERAATTILAYDYRHLDADQKAAGALMTSEYKKKYDQLFTQIAANAPQLKVTVTAQVVASGIVRSGEDRVQVLVFVNRPTTRADKTDPEIFRDQVVMTMVKSGDEWLVDNMNTNQLAS